MKEKKISDENEHKLFRKAYVISKIGGGTLKYSGILLGIGTLLDGVDVSDVGVVFLGAGLYITGEIIGDYLKDCLHRID